MQAIVRTLAAVVVFLLPGAAAGEAVDDYAVELLAALQIPSFESGREACGYIYVAGGGLRHTGPAHGARGHCDSSPDDAPAGAVVIASYHNHGAFTEDYDSEVPTVDDMDMDALDGVPGYVATPGGRVWVIEDGVASLLCRCLDRDPEHDDGYFLPVHERYSRADLERRARDDDAW